MSHDRRTFFGIGGGALLCTLAGARIRDDGTEVDLDAIAAKVKEPAGVRSSGVSAKASQAVSGNRREYWIQAEPTPWNIVPTKRDEMMDEKVRGGTRFKAFCYRAYTANWAAPLGPASMPGPVLEAEVGDSLVVNFRNATSVPVTMHPHGVFYASDMDGAYKGKYTTASGFVKPGKTFQYVWDCHEDSAGVWPYHDHGPLDPLPLYKGLFGFIHVRDPSVPRADVDHYIAFHSLIPAATGLARPFMTINGKAFAGNTPTLTAKVGQRVAQHVMGMNNDFHTYHLHGHRWKGPDGRVVDNVTIGPADSYSLEFVEDNPGRWFYHCHVFSHMQEGMIGWYLVSP